MFPPQFSLCPEEYSHLIPQGAQTLIELSEEGMGPNSGDTEYFYLGHTADRGIAISVVTELYRTKEFHCDLPLEEIKAIKERIDRLSITVECDGAGCDGSSGTLRLRFPHLHFLELHWSCFPHDSWSGIFKLIRHVRKLIPIYSADPNRSTQSKSE